jgi:lambda repressor-like predicted transcriptional regulator
MLIESYVFRAVAELLGRDPWDISPDRYRHP